MGTANPCGSIVAGKPCRCCDGNGGGGTPEVYGVIQLGPGPMGALASGVWIQIPLPVDGVQNLVTHPAIGDLVPDFDGDYEVSYHFSISYVIAAGNSVLRAILSVNGNPTGPGTPIVATASIFEMLPHRVLTMTGQTLFNLAAGDALQLWVFSDTGAPFTATAIALALDLHIVRRTRPPV